MSRHAILLTAVLFAASLAGAAPVPAGPKGEDPVTPATAKLLTHRKVQKELKMTAEQRIGLVDGLADIEEEFEKRLNKLVALPNPPQEEFDKLEREQMKAVEKLVTDTAEKALTAIQRTRLRQIECQLRGPAAFADARVQKLLNLTGDQKEAAAALAENAKSRAELYLAKLGDDDEEMVKAEYLKFRKESVKKFTDLFTPDQRDTWKALLGDPVKGFDVEELWLKIVEEEDTSGMTNAPPAEQ
jgi:hypothetical protein